MGVRASVPLRRRSGGGGGADLKCGLLNLICLLRTKGYIFVCLYSLLPTKKIADTKCDDGTDKETRALIMASVRNDCYRELHYASIYGEATNVLESLQFHCSKPGLRNPMGFRILMLKSHESQPPAKSQ